jgi:hypothetical protein
MPLAGRFYTWALARMGTGTGDAFMQTLIQTRRIPIVVHTTVRMQSDAIRNTAMVSSPGPGNNGNPVDPGPGPTPPPLPTCRFWDPSCVSCPNGSTDPACTPLTCGSGG